MNAVLLAVTLVALNAGGAHASDAPRARRPAAEAAAKDELLSCEDAEVFVRDGKFFRVVRGALVRCDPSLPPAV